MHFCWNFSFVCFFYRFINMKSLQMWAIYCHRKPDNMLHHWNIVTVDGLPRVQCAYGYHICPPPPQPEQSCSSHPRCPLSPASTSNVKNTYLGTGGGGLARYSLHAQVSYIVLTVIEVLNEFCKSKSCWCITLTINHIIVHVKRIACGPSHSLDVSNRTTSSTF